MKKLLLTLMCAACVMAADASEGALKGLFTINAEGGRIAFSQGNLQYKKQGKHATAQDSLVGIWRFAEHQYDVIGEYNIQNLSNDDWISFFGWGTSGFKNTATDPYAVCYMPWVIDKGTINDTYNAYGYGPSTHRPDADLVGTSAYYDWGVYNAISNGGDQPGLWRLMSRAEWEYLLGSRANAKTLFTLANVDGTNGFIIFPDDWTAIDTIPFVPIISDSTTSQYNPDGSVSWVHPRSWKKDYFADNIYTLAQWEAMEAQGAVFLPAEGWRGATRKGQDCNYWTSTHYNERYSFRFLTNNGVVDAAYSGSGDRYLGFSVRLVQDYVALSTISLDKDSLSINIGDSDTLRVVVAPEDATFNQVVWSSDDESVATVENGIVTAVGTGNAHIIATASDSETGEKTAVCAITVYDLAAIDAPNTVIKARKCIDADGFFYIILPDGTRINAQGISLQ